MGTHTVDTPLHGNCLTLRNYASTTVSQTINLETTEAPRKLNSTGTSKPHHLSTILFDRDQKSNW